MRMDANAHHLMVNDELLLPILLAFVPRLLNTQFTRSPIETPEVFALCVAEHDVASKMCSSCGTVYCTCLTRCYPQTAQVHP